MLDTFPVQYLGKIFDFLRLCSVDFFYFRFGKTYGNDTRDAKRWLRGDFST